MPSKEDGGQGTSMSYPSEHGSDVRRGSGFWSLPSVASTSAATDDSMVANRSERDWEGMKFLIYPSELAQYKILEEWEECFVQTLYPKLVAAEAAWKELEKISAEMMVNGATLDRSRILAALAHISQTMNEQALFLHVTEYPNRGNKARWHLYLGADSIGSGEAASSREILCSGFFAERRAVLKKSRYYRQLEIEARQA